MIATESSPCFRQFEPEMFTHREHQDEFETWFSRSRQTLHFTACLILGGNDGAERAVRNCWHRASRHQPSFNDEGMFRSWVVRILISEALAILHTAKSSRVSNEQPYPW